MVPAAADMVAKAEAMEVKEDTAVAAAALKVVATVAMVVILAVMALVVDIVKEVVVDMAKPAMEALKVVMALVDKRATVVHKEVMVEDKLVMVEDRLDMAEDRLPMVEEARLLMVLLVEAINIQLATANHNNSRVGMAVIVVNKDMAAAVLIRRRTKRATGEQIFIHRTSLLSSSSPSSQTHCFQHMDAFVFSSNRFSPHPLPSPSFLSTQYSMCRNFHDSLLCLYQLCVVSSSLFFTQCQRSSIITFTRFPYGGLCLNLQLEYLLIQRGMLPDITMN